MALVLQTAPEHSNRGRRQQRANQRYRNPSAVSELPVPNQGLRQRCVYIFVLGVVGYVCARRPAGRGTGIAAHIGPHEAEHGTTLGDSTRSHILMKPNHPQTSLAICRCSVSTSVAMTSHQAGHHHHSIIVNGTNYLQNLHWYTACRERSGWTIVRV